MFVIYKSDLKLQEIRLLKYLCAAFKLKSCLLFLKTSCLKQVNLNHRDCNCMARKLEKQQPILRPFSILLTIVFNI